MCSANRLYEAHVSGVTHGEMEDVFTGAPAGHSAPIRFVDCVSIHDYRWQAQTSKSVACAA